MLDNLSRRLSGIFRALGRKGKITEADLNEVLREVRVALLEADVNFAVAKDLIARIKEKAIGEQVFGSLTADQTIIKVVRDELTELLGSESIRFNFGSSPPAVVLLCGLQGSGKTTTAAKLCVWLKKQGKKPMLAACDLQRPAAITQLEVLGEQIEVPVFASREAGRKAEQVAQEALERCKYLMNDVLVVDTAGRLQVDDALMEELRRVHRAVKPTETLIVLDSTTGQEAVNVAQRFHETVPLTGAIFTKLDGDTRGGAVLSVRAAIQVPVRFIGVGEQTDALDQFHPDRMAQRILGFGDVMGIIERAEQAIDQKEVLSLEAKMKTGNFDFNDMLAQFSTMRKMGPLKNVLKMLPGVNTMIPEGALDNIDERHVNRIEAIILSMTPKERSNPDIINGSRRKRLALGSGTSVEEVNNLIKQLYDMRRAMRQVSQLQGRLGKMKKRR
jgi:signal recognition particle subunit SRP54